MLEATISIDLGASYTKVGFRRGCVPKQKGSLKENAHVLMVDGSPLVPSIAVHTKRSTKPWIFGSDAANLKPSNEMEVFQNWKANLFRPQNDKESAAAVIVATHFFGWLKAKIETAGVDLRQVHTRVAMPAFQTFDEMALVVARCMELNGWDSPLILKATEPHANTIGLFSKGRNVVSLTAGGEVLLNYGQTFGHGSAWVQTARGFTLFGTRSNLFVAMVVDIGAFTTDIASMTFDVSGSADEVGDGLKAIQQESYALGVINELDRPLFDALGTKHKFDWSELSFQESELVKQALYQGQQRSVLTRSSGEVILGEAADCDLITAHTETFTQALWHKILSFIESKKPSVVYLTGGGAMILPIAEGLKKRLNQRGIGFGDVEQSGPANGYEQWRPWNDTGQGLHRLATAVGGASVVLQASAQINHDAHARPQKREPILTLPSDQFFPCRCQGGNKDCCFCGGRGFYPKR